MYDTMITVCGRLVADPVLRGTSTGGTRTTFRLATNTRRPKPGSPGEFEDGPTSFYNVSTFRALGANAALSLKKGDPVIVHGSIELSEFDRQDGSRGQAGDITARVVGHDLGWGVTAFRKVARGGSAPADQGVFASQFRAAGEAMAQAQPDGLGEHPGADDCDEPAYEVLAEPGETSAA